MRVVLDTNVVVSALLFRKGGLSWLRTAWKADFVPIVDKPCVQELIRVLAYPKFRLTRREIESLLGDFLPYAEEAAKLPQESLNLPECRDHHDQKFLILAESGRAETLVTGDKALLDLAGRTGFAIETPSEFRRRLPPGA